MQGYICRAQGADFFFVDYLPTLALRAASGRATLPTYICEDAEQDYVVLKKICRKVGYVSGVCLEAVWRMFGVWENAEVVGSGRDRARASQSILL